MSRHAAIFAAAIARLETAGFIVYERRDVERDPVTPEQTPCLCLYDNHGKGGAFHGKTPIGSWDHDLNIAVIGYFSDDTAEAEAWKMLGKVLTEIGRDVRWGGLAERTGENVEYKVGLVAAGEVMAGFQLTITIEYRTGRWEI